MLHSCLFDLQGGLTALLPRVTDDARRLRLGSGADTNADMNADMNAAPAPTASGGPSDVNTPDGAKVTERHSNLAPTDRSVEALS